MHSHLLTDMPNRVNQYPNGSIVYLMIESNNITTHETKLKELRVD